MRIYEDCHRLCIIGLVPFAGGRAVFHWIVYFACPFAIL
jgi:hypothetical protein